MGRRCRGCITRARRRANRFELGDHAEFGQPGSAMRCLTGVLVFFFTVTSAQTIESPCTARIVVNQKKGRNEGEVAAVFQAPGIAHIFRSKASPHGFTVERAPVDRPSDAEETIFRAVEPTVDALAGWWRIPEETTFPEEIIWNGVQERQSDDALVVPAGAYRLRYTYAVASDAAESTKPDVVCTCFSRVFNLHRPQRWDVISDPAEKQ